MPIDADRRYRLDRLELMVLDPNEHMRSILRGILRAFGVRQLFIEANSEEGLRVLQESCPDVILLERQMAPSDGLEFARAVRTSQDSPNPYIPMVMLSADADIHNVEESRDAGVNVFLAKPVSPSSLFQRISWLVDNPRPFLRTKNFFGPDRRWRDQGPPRGCLERRQSL